MVDPADATLSWYSKHLCKARTLWILNPMNPTNSTNTAKTTCEPSPNWIDFLAGTSGKIKLHTRGHEIHRKRTWHRPVTCNQSGGTTERKLSWCGRWSLDQNGPFSLPPYCMLHTPVLCHSFFSSYILPSSSYSVRKTILNLNSISILDPDPSNP